MPREQNKQAKKQQMEMESERLKLEANKQQVENKRLSLEAQKEVRKLEEQKAKLLKENEAQ